MPRIGLQVRVPAALDKRQLKHIASEVLKRKGVKSGVNIIITDERQIRELNRVFRRKDRVTDVLAFPLGRDNSFVFPPEECPYLGEIIICYPQAVRQAQVYNQPIGRELALLVIHGILHLLGYDDEDARAAHEMRLEEQRLLAEIVR